MNGRRPLTWQDIAVVAIIAVLLMSCMWSVVYSVTHW